MSSSLPDVRDIEPMPAPVNADAVDHQDGDNASVKKSAATVLVDLACERYVFGVSTDGETFAVPTSGDPVARLLRGGRRGLRAELAKLYFEHFGRAVPQQALADALLVIEGMADNADPEPLAQRVADTDGTWWIDLGDTSGNAVRIADGAWSIAIPEVRFRRTALTGVLPEPVRGASLDELWALLNVSEVDRPLVAAWLVSALIAGIPHPVLNLAGEQGTGKSTAARIITSLVDPSPVPLRKAPRDPDSWVTAAAGSWVVAVDNVSTIPDWLSDSLCRAVTGDGDVRRQLYTDAGLSLFAFRRCILLNGIDLGAVRGDLADRLLVVDLDVIADRDRKLDADVTEQWERAYPRVFGALLDLAASVASQLLYVRLETSPRMADFARVLAAVDQVLGTAGYDRYINRARTLAADALSADPFVVTARRVLTECFTGTSADLLAIVIKPEDVPSRDWPSNARKLTTLLKRQAPVMRRAGWKITELSAGHDNALRWDIRRPETSGSAEPEVATSGSEEPEVSHPEIACESHSQASQHSRQDLTASDASVASVESAQSKDAAPEGHDDVLTRLFGPVDQQLAIEPSPAGSTCPTCGAPAAPGRLCADCSRTEAERFGLKAAS